MNHDAPMTPAAMQAHIAELEQQLKLSDEGVSQLAQRCLELEQQLLACQTELPENNGPFPIPSHSPRFPPGTGALFSGVKGGRRSFRNVPE